MNDASQESHGKPSMHGFHANYLLVFVALCVCTLISVATDLVDFGSRTLLTIVVLAVAVAKALFVMIYFMHLKFEGRWKFVLLAPTLILAVGLPLALLPDIGMHYYRWTDAAKEGAGTPQAVLEAE
ncbi:MAG: cytochrome C oxidase subunit IV family protein [Planctomycetota bacterium]|nr:cytochrome C oxidase subunit IV family protein [Planctomycetota bacterium]